MTPDQYEHLVMEMVSGDQELLKRIERLEHLHNDEAIERDRSAKSEDDESRIVDLEAKLANANWGRNNLRKELASAQDYIRTLKDELSDRRSDADRQREYIEELEAELEAARDDVHNSQTMWRKTEDRLAVEEASAEKLYRRIEELEARNKLLDAENQSVHEAMKETLQTVEAQDIQLANLDGVTEELDAANWRIGELEAENARLDRRHELAEIDRRAAEHEANRAEDLVGELQSELDTVRAEALEGYRHAEKLDEANRHVGDLKARIRALEGKPNHPNLRDADGDLWVWARFSDDHQGYVRIEQETALSSRESVEKYNAPVKEERWVTFQ